MGIDTRIHESNEVGTRQVISCHMKDISINAVCYQGICLKISVWIYYVGNVSEIFSFKSQV